MIGKWFGKDPQKPLEVRKPRSRASAWAEQLGAGEAEAVSLPTGTAWGQGLGQEAALRVTERQKAPNSGAGNPYPTWGRQCGLPALGWGDGVVPCASRRAGGAVSVPAPATQLLWAGASCALTAGGHHPMLNGVWCDRGAGEQPPAGATARVVTLVPS